MRVTVEADGGSRGNPGPAGSGAVVLDGSDVVLAERADFLGVETNNVAEYRGLIAGLQAAAELGADEVDVRMDSKLVVEQMRGAWQIRNDRLRELAAQARELADGFAMVTYTWIPRAKNVRADALANKAMDAARTPAATTPAADSPPSMSSWTPPTGPLTRLTMIRHGSTAHSAERRLSGRNDLPLDPAGASQAAALAGRATGLLGAVGAVVSSPLLRARQTADWVASAVGLPVEVDEGFAEVDFGEWEGLTLAEAAARDEATVRAWLASPDVAPPGGESLTALAERVAVARDRVLAAYPGGRVAVVTHVTPIKSLVRSALDAPHASMYRMFLDTASVSWLDYAPDGTPSLRLFNDTSHLRHLSR